MDPTDRVVYWYKWSVYDRKIPFQPDLSKVLYCEYCDSYCSVSSKHCRECNRCVDGFDHHCMWFNNCVGNKNYRSFLVSITATLAFCIIFVIESILSSFSVDFNDKKQVAQIVLGWVVGLTLLIFGILVGNLVILHIYLQCNGMTTYSFIMKQRREEEEAERLKKNKENCNKN